MLLATAAAALATRVADAIATAASKVAATSECLAKDTDAAAFTILAEQIAADKEAALRKQDAAYRAYQKYRANFQDATWVAITRLADARAKHAAGLATVVKC